MGTYTQYPSVNSLVPGGTPQPVTSSVQPKNFMGSGTFAGGSSFNLGGPSGISLAGTQGIWAGTQNFADAPFSVSLTGVAILKTASIQTSPGGQRVFVGPFSYGGGSVEGIQIYNVAGAFSGLIYGSGSGVTIADANTPGGNEALTFDQTHGLAYLTSLNGTDVSAQNTGVTISVGAGTPAVQLTVGNGTLGFFGLSPSSQYAGGPNSAGSSYNSNVQGMVNAMYTALRGYGLLS